MLIDEYGRLLLNVDSKKRTWYDYVLKLFEDNCRSVTFASWNTSGSPLLMSEIMHALKLAKISKAMGPDMVSVEVLKLLEEDFMDALNLNSFNKFMTQGKYPKTGCYLPLWQYLKKVIHGNVLNAANLDWRATSRKCSYLLYNGIRPKCDEELGRLSFRSGMGTRFSCKIQKCKEYVSLNLWRRLIAINMIFL